MPEQPAKLSRGHDLAKTFNYILKRWASFTLFDLNGTVGLHTPDQFACGLEGRPAADRPQGLRLAVPELLDR